MRDTFEVLVGTQWASVTGRAPRNIDEDFFTAGGTSLQATTLVGALGVALSRPVDLSLVFEGRTVRAIAGWLRREPVAQNRFLTLNSSGDGAPLVLLPSGGGGVIGLDGLGSTPMGRPIHAVIARGLDPADGEPLGTLAELIDDFAALLAEREVPQKLHLGGFCSGGVFAYELARRLICAGWDVRSVHLFNTSVYQPPVDVPRLVSERIAAILRTNGVPNPDASRTPREAYDQLREAGAELVENDFAAFYARLLVFATLGHCVAGYLPPVVDVAVRLYSTPERDDPESVAMVGNTPTDWAQLGLKDFEQYDTTVGHFELLRDPKTLAAVRAALVASD